MPKKSLGQNFLSNPFILSKIIEASKITPDDIVVEIGPGQGILTKMLTKAAHKVIAIELDPYLYEKLTAEFGGHDNIEILLGDALKYSYEELETFKVVANIPYYITTPIIFRLIEVGDKMKSMTLTIQKEVAERIVARPGTKEYGVLSIAVRYFCEPRLEFIVPKEAFRPVPKVDSAVIHIERLERPRVKVMDEKLFFRTVRTAFSQRRKTLSNSLRSVSEDIKSILLSAGIDPVRRAETLSIEEFARLSDIIKGLDLKSQ
ncbi:MAG: ribosomal RNA small subunit methyltransferase A [Deltaproteobacteria bacterium]|nr:ribosomal RNA small subunit methyltransferase A [Deltaproteobacteria bacterium]